MEEVSQLDHVDQALVELVQQTIVVVADLDIEDVELDTFLFPDRADELGIDPKLLDLKTNTEVSLDSLDMLDIIVSIEGTLDVRFDLESEAETGGISAADFASPALVARFLRQRVDASALLAWLDART